MITDTDLQICASRLEAGADLLAQTQVLLGFDAYVDYIVRPIRSGYAGHVQQWFSRMEDLGALFMERAGKNCSIELDEHLVKLGGNAPICAHALGSLGTRVTCVAPFGEPQLHSAFTALSKNCNCFSVGNPGLSYAMEFENGKAMLCLNGESNELNWQRLSGRVGLKKLRDLVNDSNLLYFLNWGETPGATDIFSGMAKDILSGLNRHPRLIIDLSDCARRGPKDFLALAHILRKLSGLCETVLNLNKNEADMVCTIFDINKNLDDVNRGQMLLEELSLFCVVFHHRERSTMVSGNMISGFETCFNGTPLISTGAGDNFNAGLGVAMLLDLPQEEWLITASLTAGYYVEHGESPNLEQLTEYMRRCGCKNIK